MSFDTFWKVYPLKRKKKDAQKVWTKLAPSQELDDFIVEAVREQIRVRHRMILQRLFVPNWPNPDTFLRGERWEDELLPTPRLTMANDDDLQQLKEDAQRRNDLRAAREKHER